MKSLIWKDYRLARPLLLVGAALIGSAYLLGAVMEIWSSWYPNVRPVPVVAEASPTPPGPAVRASGAFLSGGIDSFYMVLRDRNGARPADVPAIERLLLVHGFDIPIAAEEEFTKLRDRIRQSSPSHSE